MSEYEDYNSEKAAELNKAIEFKPIKTNLTTAIDLGFCTVNQTTSRLFYLENPNNQPCEYSFESQAFEITPLSGHIPSKGRISFNVSYTPKEATAIIGNVILNLPYQQPIITKVSAIGKYPYISLSTQKLNFEQLLIGKQLVKEITIKNQSQVTATFSIVKIVDDEYKDNAFSLDVNQGEIPPKSSFLVKVTYTPMVVDLISVVHYKVICPGGNDLVFACSGNAVGFDVRLSAQSINFGEVKIGNETSRLLTIQNMSDLPTSFQFSTDQNNIFAMSQVRGVIKPKSNARIIIYFKPRHTICYYERIFCVVRNHRVFPVDLLGTCYDLLIKPLPIVQKHIESFRRRVIWGKLSEIDFKYMENAFLLKYNQNQNNLEKNTQLSSLNKNGMALLGSQKASQLQSLQSNMKKDNSIIQKASQTAIGFTNRQQNSIQQDPNQIQDGMMAASYVIDDPNNATNPILNPNQVVLHKEMFLPANSDCKLIQLNEDIIDFGFQEGMMESGAKQIELVNKLQCKITVFWTIQQKENVNGELYPVFMVRPETASMKPNTTKIFEVTFRPVKNSQYYFQYLQFFVFKYSSKITQKMIEDIQKNQSKTFTGSFRDNLKLSNTLVSKKTSTMDLIGDETVPPYSGSLRCVGHSFGINSQPFIPILEFSPSNKIYFSACSLEDSIYQTVEIKNNSDTPTYFKFLPDPSKTYRVYPNAGMVEGKSFFIVTIEFRPTEYKAYNNVLTCSLNNNSSTTLNLYTHGYCSKPKLHLQNEGKVYFPPSFTGVYSRQKVKVENLSRVTLEYEIKVPEKYSEELYLEPVNGKIQPNEHIFLDCSFIPYKKKSYKIKVPLVVKEIMDYSQNLIGYHLPGSGDPDKPMKMRDPMEVAYNFEIFGAGGDGSLSITPEQLQFDVVKVNFRDKKYATLHNYSNVTFYIELKLRPARNQDESQDVDDEEQLENLEKNFSLDFKSGIIAANSKVDIGIIFNPNIVADYDLIMDVIASEKNPKAEAKGRSTSANRKFITQKCSLKIQAKGSYPLLKIVDVRNDSISVATLWENFQINKINSELQSELNEDEKQYLNIEQLNFSEAQQLQKRIKQFEWNFGYLPAKNANKPRKIVITIQNAGGTDLDWNFKLPSDNQIEVEPWADPGEPDEEEAFEKAILERNIFQIQPRSGTLKKGELKDVELVYNPSNIDENDLPFKSKKNKKVSGEKHQLRVVLQILNGKPLQINLQGMALAPLEGLLAVKKKNYKLPDTPIGLLIPVKFPIEVLNVGSSKISYKVEIVEKDEYNNPIDSKFNIFDIEKNQDNLLPNEKSYLYCLFKPLESKTYYHELKIIVYDFVKVNQEISLFIEGTGYSKKSNSKSNLKKEEIPRQRSFVSTIGSKVFFSIEEIDFGEMKPGKAAHRCIILYNLSETQKLSYDFGTSSFALSSNKPGLMCGDECTIEPMNGTLEPNSFIELKVTLVSSYEPSVYEGELECTIQWDGGDQKNKTVSQQSQNSNSGFEKETLFLRVKKTSVLDVELINSFKHKSSKDTNKQLQAKDLFQGINLQYKHAFEIIIEKAINEILNDTYTENIIRRIDNQPVALYASFNGENPADIQKIQKGLENESRGRSAFNSEESEQVGYDGFVDEEEEPSAANDYRFLFLQDEFVDLVDLIMENTFFNVIQETTRKECDLLRVAKTFVMPIDK
ncbi:hypothetical protein ABPG74_018719 [Tetrahymena malaccensis]